MPATMCRANRESFRPVPYDTATGYNGCARFSVFPGQAAASAGRCVCRRQTSAFSEILHPPDHSGGTAEGGRYRWNRRFCGNPNGCGIWLPFWPMDNKTGHAISRIAGKSRIMFSGRPGRRFFPSDRSECLPWSPHHHGVLLSFTGYR